MPEPAPYRLYRFGIFELEAGTGELRKDGKSRPRLQGQPLEVLLVLLERPGELVTREALRQRLWPPDTFVDYDHSLNAAVNKLREALSDSAENPRFIQTIPRRGYRFVAPVEAPAKAPAETPVEAPVESMPGPAVPFMPAPPPASAADPGADAAPAGIAGSRATLLSDPRELPMIPGVTARVLFSLIQVTYLSFYVASLSHLDRTEVQLAGVFGGSTWAFVLLVATALAGIPVRLYLFSAAVFGYRGLAGQFLKLFPGVLFLDALWALAPFLLVDRIGVGLALAVTAALLYLPFSQRSVLLMGRPH